MQLAQPALDTTGQILLALLMAVAAAIDLRWRRIPNWLVLAGILAGLLWNTVGSGLPGLARAAAARAPEIPAGPVLAHLRRDLEVWRSVAQGVKNILVKRGEEFMVPALQALEQFDQGNVTYLVQRYGDFDNRHFHWALFQSGEPEDKVWSLRYYLRHVMLMAQTLAQTLEECLARLGAPG